MDIENPGLCDEFRAEYLLIIRAKPGVMVSNQDRELAPSFLELGERSKAQTLDFPSCSLAGRIPEVANVSDEMKGIGSAQGFHPGCEAQGAVGAVESQMHVAGKVDRHGERLPRLGIESQSRQNKVNSGTAIVVPCLRPAFTQRFGNAGV